jgi:hypothetical protein
VLKNVTERKGRERFAYAGGFLFREQVLIQPNMTHGWCLDSCWTLHGVVSHPPMPTPSKFARIITITAHTQSLLTLYSHPVRFDASNLARFLTTSPIIVLRSSFA